MNEQETIPKDPVRYAQDRGIDFEYPTDTPGRWFGPAWNWRVFPPGETGERPGGRVLAWRGKQWDCINAEDLRDGDVWLPTPGRPFPRKRKGLTNA